MRSGYKKTRYQKRFAKEMLAYFTLSPENAGEEIAQNGLPSFVKFASRIGVTVEELNGFRKIHPEFDRAYAECEAKRNDLLIDGVVTKRFDSAFVRGLLQKNGKDGAETPVAEGEFKLTLTVLRE